MSVTAYEAPELTGYGKNCVCSWCRNVHLSSIQYRSASIIPKILVVDFLCSEYFRSILGQHFYDDGSYVFVVDSDGRIIYHVDRQRLNDVVLDNEVVEKVVKGEQGAQGVTNTKGVEMLAGYSHIAHAGWGVIAQRPSEAALVPAWSMVKKLAMFSLPLVLIGFSPFASNITRACTGDV